MTEVKVVQGSAEWHEMRQCVTLTASKFGDAVGAGLGLPWDFLLSQLNPLDGSHHTNNSHTRHGHEQEPIINEAYQLLTGLRTEAAGLWLPADKCLEGVVGASPDAKVYRDKHLVGLAEYKAPVYAMYKRGERAPQGIPRHYMCQIQGQMGVAGQPWCDFLAVCVKTREIMLKRVHFQPLYWRSMVERIKEFSITLKEGRRRQSLGLDPFDTAPARQFRQSSQTWRQSLLPGEKEIKVEELLETDHLGRVRSLTGMWFTFEILMGESFTLSPELDSYCKTLFKSIDAKMSMKGCLVSPR